ncbi:MAG: indolepyruvate oxidoreductase subunit beta [Desulfovibrio sp.]|jgi:indolepyruvate ferredoxin oxidoreductase beta subunit|nr:indolepyruvate oxidoreductase subunit beta [Desulfovibrio sp.]
MNLTLRIYLTGVGGQGTLTATTLLARAAVAYGLEVVSGEIHGMAQRGGIVESTVLLGGFRSPTIRPGEADLVLGFEALESMRAVPYLAPGGAAVCATDFIPPPGVSMGRERLPDIEDVRETVERVAGSSLFLSIDALGRRAGVVRSGNTALLGAACAAGFLPFGPEILGEVIRRHLPPKDAEINLRALELGREAAGPCRERQEQA